MSLDPKRARTWAKVCELYEFEIVFNPCAEIYGVRRRKDAQIIAFDSPVNANCHCPILRHLNLDARNRKVYQDWHGIVMGEGLAE